MNTPFHVLITDHGFRSIEQEERILGAAGAQLSVAQCKTSADVIRSAGEMDGLLVQWAPVDAEAIAALRRCKIIVRYGIGVDNVDLAAAKAKGIAVCNIPDYGTAEVAEHAVSLALALARQLPFIDRRLRAGIWKIVPDRPMPALGQSTFATAGFGRIARAAHQMMAGFGVRAVAYDPWVSAAEMQAAGVEKLERAELFRQADLLSLHLPLTAETRHFVGKAELASMRPTAVLVNTARGALVDTVALAEALELAEA